MFKALWTDWCHPRLMARLMATWLVLMLPGALQAANYVFPGNLPSGCSGSAGNYTCGSVTLGASDTIAIGTSPTTISFTSLNVNKAQINASGSANGLRLVISGGMVNVLSGALINAHVTAGYVSSSGGATFGGNITTTSTYVSLGNAATVLGSIYAQTYVDIGDTSNVGGSITSATSYIDTSIGSTIGGSLAALGTYVDIHRDTSVGGSIKANSYVSMTTNNAVAGNITARTTVTMGSGSSTPQCVRSENANAITIPSASAVGGACCGSGSTCTSTCVSGNPKPPACAWPSSGLVAEYRFEETSYSGASSEVQDSSGNKNHGTMIGGVSSTANGRICRGMLVPKNTTSAVQAFDTGIDVNALGNAGTIAFWYRSVTSGKEHRMLFDATTSSGGRFYLYRDDDDDGIDLNFHLTDGGGSDRDVDKLNILTDGVWGHVAVTWRFTTGSHASRMRLYVNGVLVDEEKYSVASGVISNAINTLYFGDNRSSVSPELNSANGTMDQIKLYAGELSAAEISALMGEAPSCAPPPPHHLELTMDSSTGLTCQPATVTVRACADASCSSTYLGGVTGTVTFTGGSTAAPSQAFSIAPGSDSTTVPVHVVAPGSTTLGLSGLSVSPTAGATPYCGLGTAATAGGSCVFTAADSGLLFNVPDHVAGDSQAITVSAVRKADNSLACTPAFASTSKNINFQCSYSNPTTGFVPAVVAGAALNAGNNSAAACDGAGRSVSLAFNASGVASTTVTYADAGQVTLNATYTGSGDDAGLSMTGSDTFIAAPAGFSFSGVTAGPIKAGAAFGATVTAVNSSGAKTSNFGRETSPASATLSFTKRQPTGVNSQAGSFTGSLGAFSSGEASASNLVWSEVGNADLSATSSNYLGSGLTVSGSTGSGPAGAVGPFVPDHFTVAVDQACAVGTPDFTYSGEPFDMTVTAHNVAGNPTLNYDGTANTSPNFAKAVTLSAATQAGLGTLGTTALAASSFAGGEAILSTQSFTFTNKLTAPATVNLRAVDSDGVSSAGHVEGGVSLRSGRLRMFNKFGSEKTALAVPLQAQHWTGQAWIINSADSCTEISTGSVVRARYLDSQGAVTTAWSSSPSGSVTLANGLGTLTMSAPTGGATGTVELAINLGTTTTDASCLSVHPASTGLNKPWLRSVNGSCATTHDRDPSARATFGIFKPETEKAVHVRELY